LEYAKKQDIPAIAAYSPDPRVAPGESWAFPQAPRPTTFLIDRSGVIRRVMVGSRSGEHLRALLTDLVAPSASAAVQQRDEADGVRDVQAAAAPAAYPGVLRASRGAGANGRTARMGR
jgi:hypothetical protein